MAQVYFAPGKEPLIHGERTIMGYVVEAHTEDVTAEDVVINDERNDPIIHIVSGGMREYSFDVIPLKSVEAINAKPGDRLKFGEIDFVLVSISKKGSNKDVEKWTIKGKTVDNIDYDLVYTHPE